MKKNQSKGQQKQPKGQQKPVKARTDRLVGESVPISVTPTPETVNAGQSFSAQIRLKNPVPAGSTVNLRLIVSQLVIIVGADGRVQLALQNIPSSFWLISPPLAVQFGPGEQNQSFTASASPSISAGAYHVLMVASDPVRRKHAIGSVKIEKS